jgi:ATP/maltotriose-dependent transcriptional regulator MalT
MTYGWTLRVQGQLEAATGCLTKAVSLALETNQRSLASIAYFQLAVTARMQGDLERSQAFNEESMALNRAGENSAAELVSMWPRIASAFQSLHAGRLDEAERRLQRVINYLDTSDSFRNHRNSATIGLGLVALGRGNVETARTLLAEALSDPINLYPYTHIQGLLGLAKIAAHEDEMARCCALLRQALAFAGNRSLIEEYVEVVLEIARLNPADAPVEALLRNTYALVETADMAPTAAQLRDVAEEVTLSAEAGMAAQSA